MKQLLGNARNLSLTIFNAGEVMPMAEIVLMLVEPTWRVDASGNVVKSDENIETVRFQTCETGLRNLAKTLENCADELLELCTVINQGDVTLWETKETP